MPDAFEEGIFPSPARLEFLTGESRIIDLSAKLSLKSPHSFREDFAFRVANHQDINVARCILLISRKRSVEVCLAYSFNLPESLSNERYRSYRFGNNASDLLKQGILAIELKRRRQNSRRMFAGRENFLKNRSRNIL